MARFEFRLQVSLRLAEQALQNAQRNLAVELRRLQVCRQARETQATILSAAQAFQREAAQHQPENLGLCHRYALEQQKKLKQCEKDVRKQESVTEEARLRLLTAHREAEKLRRLKEKQFRAFLLTESRKEQKQLDETGQIMHWRQQLKEG